MTRPSRQNIRPAWTSNRQNPPTHEEFPNLTRDRRLTNTGPNSEATSSITDIINLLSDNDLLQKITWILKKLTESPQILNTIVDLLKNFTK